ncbi:MAG: PAS domain-containing protein [Bacteroidales bacterium]|nr:PAS domain-containing protein [Bacteroidales bacterium]
MQKNIKFINKIKSPVFLIKNHIIISCNNELIDYLGEDIEGQDFRTVFTDNSYYSEFEQKISKDNLQVYFNNQLYDIQKIPFNGEEADFIVFIKHLFAENNNNCCYNSYETVSLGCFRVFFDKNKQIKEIVFTSSAYNIFGINPQKSSSEDVLNLFNHDDKIEIFKRINHIIENNNEKFEYIFTTNVHELRQAEFFLRGYYSTENGEEAIVCNIINLSNLNILTDSYFNLESNYKTLFSNNLDPIVIVDEFEILAFNRTAKEIAEKYGVEIKSGMNFLDFLNVSENQHGQILNLLNNKSRYEISLNLKNGETVQIENSIIPVYFEKKLVNAFIIKDLTAQKKLVHELKETNAALTKFLSIISHDLRTPFIQVISLAEIINDNFSVFDEKDLKKYIGLLDQAGKNGYNLLENMLEWSKVIRNKNVFEPIEFDISEKIKETISFVETNATTKNISLEFSHKETIVYADENMIGTILLNLISNAIKFTPKGGNIKIEVGQIEKNIQISVKDNGIGMNETAIDSLFRIDKNYTTKGTENETGTGLGLLLVQELIKKHKGEIWAESTPKVGTTFYFTIPQKK